MARPITWQDVAGPAQTPGLLLAGQRAGEQLVDAFSGLGDTIRNVGNVQKKVATEAAIASIANAADPAAAAAAVPKGWQFDPLAIAGATNARTDQLLSTEVKRSNLAENEAQISDLKSKQQDRESARLVAGLVAPLADDAFAGKDLQLDMTNPVWQTPAGMDALKYLDQRQTDGLNARQEEKRIRIAQSQAAASAVQARAASEQLRLMQVRMKTDDEVASYLTSREGSMADGAVRQRAVQAISERNGAGAAYGLSAAEKYGSVRGRASNEELDRPTSAGATGRELLSQQAGRVATAKAVEAKTLASWDPLLKLGQEYDKNPFQGAEDFTSVAIVRKLVEGFEGNDWLTSRYEDNDIIERVDYIVNWAKENDTPIEKDQAWMIVGKTLGSFTGGQDETDRIINSQVKRDIELFDAFNKKGKSAGIAVSVESQKAQTQKVIDDATRASIAIEGALIGGQDIPETLRQQIRKSTQKGASAGY